MDCKYLSPVRSGNVLGLEFKVRPGLYRAIWLFGFFWAFPKIICHCHFYRFNTCEFSLKK